MFRIWIVLLSIGLVSPAIADEPNSPPHRKDFCREDPGFGEWDFWVGNWTVTQTGKDTYLGRNSIRKLADGCLLVEEWNGIQDTYGMSLNYYNPHTGVWRQVWVDNAGYSIDFSGGLVDGAIVLEGTFHTHADGSTTAIRGTWTPLDDGAVRQVFEFQNPKDGSWTVNWDARYERSDTEAPEETP